MREEKRDFAADAIVIIRYHYLVLKDFVLIEWFVNCDVISGTDTYSFIYKNTIF